MANQLLRSSARLADELTRISDEELIAPPPVAPHQKGGQPGWRPDLNPAQWELFEDNSRYVLAHGEKGSGKSVGILHRAVRHAYEEDNALAVLITPSLRTAREGSSFELETLVLPQWTEGIGLTYTDFKLDAVTKDRICWVGNQHNGWSKLILMSLPYPEVVEPRMKAMSPSFVFIDELTECRDRCYFTYSAAQLGRRRGIKGPQQFYGATNPAGPSHWVYKCFFEEPTERNDKNYKTIHVPITDNMGRLPDGYVDSLKSLLAHDPTAFAQLIKGEWIDRPTGESLFAQRYNPRNHLKGDPLTDTYPMPIPGFPVQIGYDLGSVFNAVVFLQAIPVEGGIAWLIFDELCYLKERIIYKRLVKDLLEKMDEWNGYCERPLLWEHISDSTALNVWRPSAEGSYDAMEIEKLSEGRIRMVGCPKGKGSVDGRVTLLQSKLVTDMVIVSARCPQVHAMLLNLEADSRHPTRPRRSKHLHIFDALTYPMFAKETGGYVASLDERVLEFLHVQR